MFDQNYHSEKAIKKIARVTMSAGFILLGLAALAAFIILAINARYLWWISLIVLGGGLISLLASYIGANLLWGFGEIVGNSNRIAMGATSNADAEDAPLPEL